jgi:hypothetical protein
MGHGRWYPEIPTLDRTEVIYTFERVLAEPPYTPVARSGQVGREGAGGICDDGTASTPDVMTKGDCQGGYIMAVNVKLIGEAVQGLARDLGDGLVACDVWSVADGVSLGGQNSQPAATAVFNRITDLIAGALKDSRFPMLNRYYMLDLSDGKMVVVMPIGDLRAGMLVDTSKTQLGIILSVAVPRFRETLEQGNG